MTALMESPKPASEDDEPWSRLTAREREVLQLVAEGLTTRKIAERLNIDAKTVETHRTNMMRKLGVRDVVSLVKFAIRNGLVVDDGPPPELGPGPAA